MGKVLLFIFWFSCYVQAQEVRVRPPHPDVGLNEKQLIVKYGYPLETHTTKTEDGYILKMFRIPSGRNDVGIQEKPAVLIMSGLLANSAFWVLTGPEKGLGFILADKGYDVWLGNYRGTTWCRKHETLSPTRNKKEFWNFSYDEIGYYDLAAHIDYILNATNQEKLFYIGHSQGSTSFFALASLRPEYNEKVRLFIGLSPFIYAENMKFPLMRFGALYSADIQSIIENYGIYELLSHSPLLTVLGQLFCNDGSPFSAVCASIFYFIAGSTQHFNQSMIPVIASNMPAGASTKQIQHYIQGFAQEKFQRYDYGEADNMIKYNQPAPPEYDLSKVTVPVAIYYGDSDMLNSYIDVERAAARLPNVVEKKLIQGFNHLDFGWASDVVPLLYNDVIKIMKQYQRL